MTDIVAALKSLRPGASWSLDGDDYFGLRWTDTAQPKPSRADVEAEAARLAAIVPPRTMSQSTWCGLADNAGKLSAWLTACDTATRPKDRAYARTGGETGLYSEGNSKLARLAAAAGVDVKTMFDQASSLTA